MTAGHTKSKKVARNYQGVITKLMDRHKLGAKVSVTSDDMQVYVITTSQTMPHVENALWNNGYVFRRGVVGDGREFASITSRNIGSTGKVLT